MIILVRLPNWLGDGVMSTPMIELLITHFPHAKIYLLAPSGVAGIFSMDTRIAGVFIDTTKSARSRMKASIHLGRNIATKLGVIDIGITLTNHFYSAFILYLSGARMRIGYKRGFGGIFLTHSLPRQKHLHQVLQYAYLLTPIRDLAQAQGVGFHHRLESSKGSKHIIQSNQDIYEQSRLAAQEFLQAQGICVGALHISLDTARVESSDYKRHIGINAGAAYGSAKRWLPEYFAIVAAYFATRGALVSFYGAPQESALIESIIARASAICDSHTSQSAPLHTTSLLDSSAHMTLQKDFVHTTQECIKPSHNFGKMINLCGTTDIAGLIKEISTVDVFISNDSGPMHIATALGVQTIGIFGPTDPSETTGWMAHNFHLIQHPLPCAPCKKRECPLGHHKCMVELEPTLVIQYITMHLA